jgi:phosphoserine phosphatase
MFTATLITSAQLRAGDISAAADMVRAAGAAFTGSGWIEEGVAFDVGFMGDVAAVRPLLEDSFKATDVIVQRTSDRRRRLIVADMDSTMITVECIDELADYAGIKQEIAAVTERAMRGEMDFEDALRGRVALLKGLEESAIERCLAERVRIMPGAKRLVRTIRENGGMAVLVSGGFTRFADPVGKEIGFDRVVANVLGLENGALDGTVVGPIIGAKSKQMTVEGTLAATGWPVEASLAVGDGANDIPMIKAAGLGVAFHAKPKTAAAADARIDHGDLSVLLYAMGYSKSEWAEGD